jgi:hypothetical protein
MLRQLRTILSCRRTDVCPVQIAEEIIIDKVKSAILAVKLGACALADNSYSRSGGQSRIDRISAPMHCLVHQQNRASMLYDMRVY